MPTATEKTLAGPVPGELQAAPTLPDLETREPPPGMRLATRLALTTGGLLAACVGLALAFASSRANDVVRRKIEENLRLVPEVYRGFENAEAAARRQQVRSLADQPGTRALLGEGRVSPETCHDSARDFAANLGAGVVFLFDARGALLARSDREAGEERGRDFSAAAWVREPLTKGTDAWAYILEVKRARRLYLVAAAPVSQGAGAEQILNGVVAGGFPLDDERAVALGRLMTSETAVLANVAVRNAPPEVVAVSATPALKRVAAQSLLAPAAVEAVFRRGEPHGPLELWVGEDDYVATALPIKSRGGETIAALLVARSKDAELAPFRKIRRGIVIIGALVLLISLPISIAMARRISRPIEQLAQGAESIRGGRLDVVLPAAKGYEVVALTRAFGAMVEELKEKAALEAWVAEILRRPGDVTVAGRLTPVGEGPPEGLGIGKLFAGRYYILSVLGQGGMGTVYRVHDRVLDEDVALKILMREPVARGGDSAEGLKRETRLARLITHPNVVRAYDMSEAEGTRFLTMEYVPGTTLNELLERRGRLDLAPGLQIAKQICRGLAAVHGAGVVHGDLKPRNVMVMANGVVKLMDFGVARSSSLLGDKSGAVAGSLHYMSPEQVRGAELDAQSDVYAVGVTLFEIFTGRRPFDSSDQELLLKMHLYELPPDPRTLRPELPDTLVATILACLEKTKVKRPQTASELERALLRVRP